MAHAMPTTASATIRSAIASTTTAPGYDPALGPFGPYRDAFRSAYVRGYDQAFYRR